MTGQEPPTPIDDGAANATAQPSDERAFRACMGRFTTGVAVATTMADGAPVAVTVNSLTSVSLSPPMLLFCLDRTARSLPAFRRSGFFAISILALGQQELSTRFASGGKQWDDIPVTFWRTGAPILSESLAALECRLDAVYPGGDHEILVGAVERCCVLNWQPALLYHGGQYAELPE
ncbi:flavin reductase family protein [Fodinicurvata sp. EGI_FJ10296]|uniref:flavin reductase family protein n=1 Tax=Fodinicurvata sp. EGI_FJ10296 TaxID=3231908 RepID=UPI0034565A22